MSKATESAFRTLDEMAEELRKMSEDSPYWEQRAELFDKYLSLTWAIEQLRDHIGYPPVLDHDGYLCGNCNALLDKRYNPCPECGKKVDWDEDD